MIYEILHLVHLVSGDVVEGDGTVATTAHALYLQTAKLQFYYVSHKLSESATHHWIENVFLIPEVVRHVTSNEVMFRYKGKEPTTSKRVPVTVTDK